MTTTSSAFKNAANSPAGRHATEAAKEMRESVKSAAEQAKSSGETLVDQMSETVSDYASDAARKAGDLASDVSRKAGKHYARARDAAIDAYDEVHERAEEYPHVALGLAVAFGFLLGAVLVGRR
ncbi:MAG: hypothetical protein ACM3MH_07960 [Actinomycetota bacterium]